MRKRAASRSSGSTADGEDGEEAEEGRVVTALHRTYERSREIVRRKKGRVLAQTKRLACEVCGFDFRARCGERGSGFIECHHAKPVHQLKPGDKTRLEDLHLVCSNCHRMIHAKRPWLSISDLAALLPVKLIASVVSSMAFSLSPFLPSLE